MASVIKDDQPSPVRHWKRSSIADPSDSKLRIELIESWCLRKGKRFWPSTAKMKVRSASIAPTLTRDGSESTMVTIRFRSSLAPLSSRRIRRMRSTRSTRSTIGGIGKICASSSAANWSSSEQVTRVKSKRHQLSPK